MTHKIITQEDLPDYISMDFAMTEENLWHVWYARDEDLRIIGMKEEIYADWNLADNWEQIVNQAKKDGSLLLSGINLHDLKNLYNLLQNKGLSTWLPGFNKIYFVEKNNKQYWVSKKPRKDSEEKIIFTGKISGIKDILDSGLKILQEKNYRKVSFDFRPPCKGHPLGWKSFMIDPENAIAVRKDFEAFDRGELFIDFISK